MINFLSKIDNSWTLFLDRDGVINRKLEGDYVKTIKEFEFLPNSLEAIVAFSNYFHKIIVVTNQQGISKKLSIFTYANGKNIPRHRFTFHYDSTCGRGR